MANAGRVRTPQLLHLVVCLAVLAAGCRGVSPTAPTGDPTLTGTWAGTFAGALVAGDGMAELTQDGDTVTGNWSAPMPASLVALGAPSAVPLAGPVTGAATGTTAELTFGFAEAFHPYFGNPDCGLAVSVTSFDATMLMANWTTNASCQPPVNDSGTLTFTRQ
ncbi:MAG: hypothetical protein OXH04_11610 [Acidobacteria bacterium]|nr:hypothetical protein [Acidobacteriota bacterium]